MPAQPQSVSLALCACGALSVPRKYFGEPLRDVQLASFVLIWAAIALFSWDLLRRRYASAKPPA